MFFIRYTIQLNWAFLKMQEIHFYITSVLRYYCIRIYLYSVFNSFNWISELKMYYISVIVIIKIINLRFCFYGIAHKS
jgi:hypothetical protein